MIPELPIAMLACARLGAVHAVVFAGFSSQALRARIDAWGARVVVTSESGWRGGPAPGLKGEVDRALGAESPVETVVVVARRAGERQDEGRADLVAGRDLWWHEAVAAPGMDAACACESLEATAPLFILSTSGSAGAPKGVVHAVGGYLLYAAETFRGVFAPGDDDVHFCAADIGWITGHTYLVYGPLAVGATTLLYEGTRGQPEPDRLAELIVSQGVTTLYTTPPVVHAFMAAGEPWAAAHPMPRLKVVATVGDPRAPKPGTGVAPSSGRPVRCSTPGGRPRPAASCWRRGAARPAGRPWARGRSLAWPRWWCCATTASRPTRGSAATSAWHSPGPG